MSSPARPAPHDRPGGVGFPDPAGAPGLIATFLVKRISMVALRSPVLFVRLRSATRPGCFDRAPRAGYRRCIRHDIVGSRGGARCPPLPWRSVFLRYGRPSGDGQRYEPTVGVGQESARSGAIGPMQGLRLPVQPFVRPIATTLPTVPDGTSVRSPVPVHGHPLVALQMVSARQRRGTAGEPAQSASWGTRCSTSLSRMWLAAFKMMHRSVGRQGCGQLLAAIAACTSTLRSLTMNGPARTSPRPSGHP
jgi:hypothetical protein